MSSVEYLREFVNERLTAAAEEIFRVFIKTVVEYEEEIDRQRRLLDTVLKPDIKLYSIELPQQQVCKQQEVLAEQQLCIQERNSSLDQEDPEPPQIKEEEEEPCTSQEGEHLVLKQETDAAIKTVVEYEEEIDRQRRLLDTVLKLDIRLNQIELPQQHVCKQQEVLAEQQLCIQERNSSLDQEDPEPPQIKEEEEEPCISQEGEQLVLKQETDAFMWTPSEDQTLHFRINETQTEVAEKPLSYISVESSAVPEPNNDHQLLYHDSHDAESQDHKGGQHGGPESTRDVEPEQLSQHHKSNSHTNNVLNPIMLSHCYSLSGKSSLTCDTCGKAFKRKSEFDRHMLRHTGEKPYVCQICGKAFNDKSSFRRHLKIHTGEKPFVCQTCGKAFRSKSTLQGHQKVHSFISDWRPYSCKTCGKEVCVVVH